MRLVYDPAKTPLQRLLLCGALSEQQQQELTRAASVLDPVRVFEHLEQLQQAVLRWTASTALSSARKPPAATLRFSLEHCTTGALLAGGVTADPPCPATKPGSGQPASKGVLDWPRTRNDPFKEVWELIASWLRARPEWGSGDVFREVERLFPGQYRASQIRTLQRGIRKIRARLLETVEEPGQAEATTGHLPTPVEPDQREQEADQPACSDLTGSVAPPVQFSQEPAPLLRQRTAEQEAASTSVTETGAATQSATLPEDTLDQPSRLLHPSVPPVASTEALQVWSPAMTVDQAIGHYLQDHREGKRSPKTIEWHQTALGLFQHYLLIECQLSQIGQITETQVRGWLAFLSQTPTATGKLRSASTIETYARSAHAFGTFLVQQGYLAHSPFNTIPLPQEEKHRIQLVEPEAFEQFLLACQPPGESGEFGERAAARNRALLWMFLETGLLVSEVCSLRLVDVDRTQGRLRIGGTGTYQRQIMLSPNSRRTLFAYLDQHRLKENGRSGYSHGIWWIIRAAAPNPLWTDFWR